MVSKKVSTKKLSKAELFHVTTYSTRYFCQDIPRYEMPDESLPAEVAYRLCADELVLDGNAALNLASFVTTWMEPEAQKLIVETLNKNLVDRDEYPQTQVIEKRCVNMLSRLFNSPDHKNAVGTSTVGSSEAVMLAALSHKWNWRKQCKVKGKPADKPNIVMGGDIQVVWDKYARYFDVEARVLPLKKDKYVLDPEEVVESIDENTTCVVGVLGTTFTGQLDPIEAINDKLIALKKQKGLDVPLHVDAASGGFVIPFTQPDLLWDFRLEQVKSINVSGHKYGLVYPGVGWAIWADEEHLPEELVFKVNYLGGEMPTFNLNFSRPSSFVIAQYFNFIRLGKSGYMRLMQNLLQNSHYLADRLQATDHFKLLSKKNTIPVVTVSLKHAANFDVFDLSTKLRERGWIVPAYTMPPDCQSEAVMRIVVRENFSRDIANLLVEDIEQAILKLTSPSTKIVETSKKNKKYKVC